MGFRTHRGQFSLDITVELERMKALALCDQVFVCVSVGCARVSVGCVCVSVGCVCVLVGCVSVCDLIPLIPNRKQCECVNDINEGDSTLSFADIIRTLAVWECVMIPHQISPKHVRLNQGRGSFPMEGGYRYAADRFCKSRGLPRDW